MSARKLLFASAIFGLAGVAAAETDLTIAIPESTDAVGIESIVDSYPGADVTVVKAPYAELFDRMSAAARSGSGEFDIVMMDDPWIPFFAENDYLENLTPYFVADGVGAPDSDFLAQSLALCRNPYGTGAFICLPFAGNAQMFFYDWRQFERHGVFGAPENWDDVIKAARGVSMAGRSDSFGYGTLDQRPGLSRYGYVYRGAEGNPIVADFLPILWSYNGSVMNEKGKITLDTPEALRALDVFLQLANYAPPAATKYGAEEAGESIAMGVSASSINWPNWISVFEDPEKSAVVGRIAYASIPDGSAVGRAEIGHWVLGIAAASDDKQKAFDFITWATSPEQQRIAAEAGNPPVRYSVLTDPELTQQDRFRHYPTLMESILFSRPRPRHASWVEMERVLGTHLYRVLHGEVSPEDALAAAQHDLTAIVDGK
ncbi:MAG: ABC transporter substrate-binding protein [Gammaproteobacteria bacterium]|nr:MAG: ABC transporter substrate-binding protein [Gammaproteobacteria bacterium]